MNYMDYLSNEITKNNLIYRYQGKSVTGWQLEYDQLDNPKKSTQMGETFMHFNRYNNILPYDDNRVAISNYINASWVNGHIATQWPLQNTLKDFWEMIWTHHIDNIITLNTIERSDQMAYWEPYVIDIYRKEDIIIRTLEISFKDETRLIKHYQYTAWPDFKCPNVKSLLSLMDMAKGLNCIHCSAGVGRTGTFLTIDYCLDKIKNNQYFNIFKVIELLRTQRLSLIQSKEQYAFCFHALLYSLTEHD